MGKKPPRIEVVEPPWVKDPSKWPFSPIILPLEMKTPKRLLLDSTTLALKLHCPRDFVRALLRYGQLHEATDGERRAELGLCAEDLATLALSGVLCRKYHMPLKMAIRTALGEVRNKLLQTPRPERVILGLFRGNRGTEARIGTCRGPLAVWDQPADQARHCDFYDASDLRERMDDAIPSMPLMLPMADTCLVRRPASR